MSEAVSDCCGAPVKVACEKNLVGYTNWFVCTACSKPCDAVCAERMTGQAFDALLRRLSRPGRYCPKVAKVLSTPAPWDAQCDKTSTPADQ